MGDDWCNVTLYQNELPAGPLHGATSREPGIQDEEEQKEVEEEQDVMLSQTSSLIPVLQMSACPALTSSSFCVLQSLVHCS